MSLSQVQRKLERNCQCGALGWLAAHVESDCSSSSGSIAQVGARSKIGGTAPNGAGAASSSLPELRVASQQLRSTPIGSCVAIEAGRLEPLRRVIYRSSGVRSTSVVVRLGCPSVTCILLACAAPCRARRADREQPQVRSVSVWMVCLNGSPERRGDEWFTFIQFSHS